MVEGDEFWLYKDITAGNVMGAALVGDSAGGTSRGKTIPVVFQDGKVIGWGKSYWQEKEHRHDIKIRQQ
jgi:hypothetical protein